MIIIFENVPFIINNYTLQQENNTINYSVHSHLNGGQYSKMP